MSRVVQISPAYFGKLSSRGDFVRSAQHGELTRMLDQWLSHGMDLASTDPRWKQRYDVMTSARFAILGVRSRMALVGLLTPGMDAAGRRFPFVAAGSFELESPFQFLGQSPLALTRIWARLQQWQQDLAAQMGRESHCTTDRPSATLDIETWPGAYTSSFGDFLDTQSLGAMELLLRACHPHLDLRRTLLAIGLLLQPVPTSGVSRLEMGLTLPLPTDPLYAPMIGSFWMHLVSPFVRQADFELALFIHQRPAQSAMELCVGFAGSSPASLLGMLDHGRQQDAYVDVIDPHWAEAHASDDPAVRKLSSLLAQPMLSLRQALNSFQECFLQTSP